MTDTYKVLGQALTGELAIDDSTVKETIAYEVPAGTKASVSAIEITNSDAASQTYKLAFVPNAEVDTASTSVELITGEISHTFLANSSRLNAISADGITWTTSDFPFSNSWVVEYLNDKFIGISVSSNTNAIVYSTDGITWTQTSVPSTDGNLVSITYGGNKFVLIGINGDIFYSVDGINWTDTTLPLSREWRALAYGDGKFVLTAFNSDSFAYSTDGINWTAGTMPTSTTWSDLTYADGKFVAISNSTVVAYSTNGISWTQATMPLNAYWTSITYGNGKFVAVALLSSSFGSTDAAAYSTDGINWTASTMPSSQMWVGLTYGDGKFVAISGYYDVAAYSTDGINWTQTVLPEERQWGSLTYRLTDTREFFTESIPQSLNKHIAIYNKTISSGETHEIKGGITLSAGDQIRVYSDSAEIITNVYGVEIA